MATERYVLLERIGVGGMAEVFRASSRGAEGFERPVAIKRILPNLVEDQDFVRMFVDEAKIAVQLQHPNIVQILDLGREDREYFIAMEYVHGKDLRAVQDRLHKAGQRLPLAVTLHVGMKVCEALDHAHRATGPMGQPLGVVHRDVTPQNVLLSYDGEVKVTDFGLAKAAGRATQTQAGVVKGKLAYMAPEAFEGIPVDHRSDVFGVGVLLWEMLTGMRLFLGRNDLETVERARLANVPPLRTIDPGMPEEIDRIVLRALARDRDVRHQTAEDLHDELEAFAYEHQQFLSSASLAGWLREWFPVEPPPEARQQPRAPEIVTREIRLGDVGRGSRPGASTAARSGVTASPMRAPAVPTFGFDPEAGPSARASAGLPSLGDVAPPRPETIPPGLADELLEEEEADAREPGEHDALEGDAFEGETDERDTMPPAAYAVPPPDPFEDTTGRMAPARIAELTTEMRYDRDLAVATVPRGAGGGGNERDPATPVSPIPLGWDEDEDATVVGPGVPRGRR